MAETTMPATEAEVVAAPVSDDERNSYEFAFHILPTVAEGEVPGVFEELKALVTKAGGEIFDEETPERFDLAYEIVKHLEGKNRKFSSAYFGWVRFKVEAEAIGELTAAIESDARLLRYILIRLTRVEEANPFRFHEALAAEKQIENIDVPESVDGSNSSASLEEGETEEDEADEKASKVVVEEVKAEVDDAELDKALEKKEV